MNVISQYAPHGARVILGFLFLVFGLNGFFSFMPLPAYEGASGQFLGGLAAAPYFFPMLKGLEVILGLALLSNRFVPLALTVLAPITFNILTFHLFLAPAGSGMIVFIVILQIYAMVSWRKAFSGVLRAKLPEAEETVRQSVKKVAVPAA